MTGKYYESEYEKAFVQLLVEQGWEYTPGKEMVRSADYSDLLIREDLEEFLSSQYASHKISDIEIESAIRRLENVPGGSDYQRGKETYRLIREGYYTGERSDKRCKPFYISYIDYEELSNNKYRVVNQYQVRQASQTRIPDILLFVNGIPLCIIELKNPTDLGATIRDAHSQIYIRYRNSIPALMRYTTLAVISDASNSRLGTIYSDYENFYAWKKVSNKEEAQTGLGEMQTLIVGALAPERLIEIYRDFLFFPDTQEGYKEKVIVCRYPQYFATHLLRDNVIKNLWSNGGSGKGGTYFGATGCGKTMTMLFLARQLTHRSGDKLSSPTVLVILDREDLASQAGELMSSAKEYLGDSAIRVFENRADLAEELRTRQTGGLYVTTIQKFTEEMGCLSERSNIICFSDEAHRTQASLGTGVKRKSKEDFGTYLSKSLALYLREALPKATYVGFTGTPIDNTIHVFGGIVDSYTMDQSVKDGITVPIKYEARLARLHQDEEQLKKIEAYYKACKDEGVTEEEIMKSKRAMSNLTPLLGTEKRLKTLAKDIVEHYEAVCDNNPQLVQKAMIVCHDRKIAYDLYNQIVAIKPEWSKKVNGVAKLNVIATRDVNKDPKQMYDLLGDNEYRKELALAFKDDTSNFQVAVVVDMWITGFDVPSLAVLYNDKPLQKHTLIQTISRVNRKYKSKEYGLVVDYFGIRENMKAAIKQYMDVKGEAVPIEELDATLLVFKNQLAKVQAMMEGFDSSDFYGSDPYARTMAISRAGEYLKSQPMKDKKKYELLFVGEVSRLRMAFEICNPAGVLESSEAMEAQLYMSIAAYLAKISSSQVDVIAMNKTVAEMLEAVIKCSHVEAILNSKEEEYILGDDFLTEIDEVKLPLTKFELLVEALSKAIKGHGGKSKVKAQEFKILLEKTLEAYNNRDNQTFADELTEDVVNRLTDELLDIRNQLIIDSQKYKEMGVTPLEKALYDILISVRDQYKFEYSEEGCLDLARKIGAMVTEMQSVSGWQLNSQLRDKLSIDIVKLLYENKYPSEYRTTVINKVWEQVA